MTDRCDNVPDGLNRQTATLDRSATVLLRKEVSRVGSHLLLWAVPALFLVAGYWFGWVKDTTALPAALVTELQRPLERGAIWLALAVSTIALLLALLGGWTRISRFLIEELASVFYLAGSFTLMFTLAIDLGHWAWTIGPVQPGALFVAAIAIGMLIETFGDVLIRKRACWRRLGRRRTRHTSR